MARSDRRSKPVEPWAASPSSIISVVSTLGTERAAQLWFGGVVRHAEKDQDTERDHQVAEGAWDPVPLRRHPHPEPLAANRQEPNRPQANPNREPGDGGALGPVEAGARVRDMPEK